LEFWANANEDSERQRAMANSSVSSFFMLGTLLKETLRVNTRIPGNRVI
jgi:hypothetical protein